MDEPLGVGDRLRIKIHLWFCKFCARFQLQLQTMRSLLRSQKAKPEGLSDSAREKIRSAMQKS
jgi:hypothetical protein